jgi:S1-C subfamily serine protease
VLGIEVGDTVIAIGNPFGLSDVMTTGIVSAIGRSIPISVDSQYRTQFKLMPGLILVILGAHCLIHEEK